MLIYLHIVRLVMSNIITDFIMKAPNKKAIGYSAMTLSYHFPSQRIRIVYHGGERASWEKLIDLVYSLPELLDHPLLLLALAFVAHEHRTRLYRDKIDDQLWQVERDTGYGVAGTLTGPSSRLTKRQFDIESALVRLQSCQTELASVSHVLRYNEDYGQFLVESIEKLDGIYQANGQDELDLSYEKLIHLLELPRNQTHVALSQVQSLKERAQSQTSLVRQHYLALIITFPLT